MSTSALWRNISIYTYPKGATLTIYTPLRCLKLEIEGRSEKEVKESLKKIKSATTAYITIPSKYGQ